MPAGDVPAPVTSKTVDGVTRILNCLPSPGQETDWLLKNAADAGLMAAAPRALPKSVDLRDSWWGVGNQKATGSCVGWATAEGVLRWHLVKAEKIPKTPRLSPRFIWMAAKETDQFVAAPTTFIESDGTWLKAALDVARKWGAVSEPLLPFDSGALYPGDVGTFYAIATQLKIAAYFNLGTDPADWRTWLANSGPILTRLDVDDTWMNATKTKGKLTTYHQDKRQGGHAVAMVGYSSTGFIIRNSWGTGWGDKGFAYASNAYAKKAFTEAYGVSI